MALYGEQRVDIEALQRWVNTLSIDNIDIINVADKSFKVEGLTKSALETQLCTFKQLIQNAIEPTDFVKSLYNLSTLAFHAFFEVKNGAIRVANYYECFLKASNSSTYKKIIEGYGQFIKIGEVNIYDGDNLIASIGQKSDLIWQVFFEYFINYEDGNIVHTHMNHEEYLTLQLYNIENKTQEEINHLITEILLKVSVEYGLDFKVVDLDINYKLEGKATVYDLQFNKLEYEYIPSLYFINGLRCSNDNRLAFLSYYQVIEYFFVRCQNYAFLDEYSNLVAPIDHNSLRKVLQKYKNSITERESIKLVLTKSIDVDDFKTWILSDSVLKNTYCDNSICDIDLSKSNEKIIGKIAERIYLFRCAIAHAKGDVDEYIAIPSLSNSDITSEIPLVKYVSLEVLKKCSEV